MIEKSNARLFEIEDNELDKKIEDMHKTDGHKGDGKLSDIEDD